jgi:pimeloyl-ACP methyl ester carboxylesterase
MIIDTVTHVWMLWLGFGFHCTRATSVEVFPPRPAILVSSSKRSPAKQLSYWLRPHTSKTRLPVLFIHGIGVGLIPNINLLRELGFALNVDCDNGCDGQVGIMAIEILQISSRLTHAIPKRSAYLEQLAHVLDMHQFERFVLASHFYGSVLSTYILTHEPLAHHVASTLLIDPVTILLHIPDVADNITARLPKHMKEWQVWFFGSKDPGVAYTLGRHFFWTENILWYDRILELAKRGMNMTVSLGSQDRIVDAQAVRCYLTRRTDQHPVFEADEDRRERSDSKPEGNDNMGGCEAGPCEHNGLQLLWFDGLGHAQVFDTRETRMKLVNILVKYSRACNQATLACKTTES